MSTARIFAAGLNCISLELKSRPCGSCRVCSAVILDMSPNVQILDAPTVRDLSSTKTLMKRIVSQLEHKVIIIKECDSFSTDIWTALLKIMEDPPSNVVLVLISTTANRIPLAAISRYINAPPVATTLPHFFGQLTLVQGIHLITCYGASLQV